MSDRTRKAPWFKATPKPTRKPIRTVSKARAKQQAEYAKLKKRFLSTRSACWCCGQYVDPKERDLHHWFGRSGRLLTYWEGFKMVCRPCHDWVHKNPEYATAGGWICPKGMWNDYDKALNFHRQNSKE